jgi:hypothetical protein
MLLSGLGEGGVIRSRWSGDGYLVGLRGGGRSLLLRRFSGDYGAGGGVEFIAHRDLLLGRSILRRDDGDRGIVGSGGGDGVANGGGGAGEGGLGGLAGGSEIVGEEDADHDDEG